MDRNTVETKVKRIVAEQLGVTEEEVKLTSSLVEDLGCDSLDLVELLMAAEEELELEIADEAAEQWKTVGDIVEHLAGAK